MIYNFFDVKALHKNSYGNTDSRLARIQNSLVDQLNEDTKIPRAIVIILDSDIIEMMDKCDYGIRKLLFDCCDWLFTNINFEINDRIDKLTKKCPGAIFSLDEPKIFWVEAVTRPVTSAKKEIFSLVYKFNAVLRECLENFKNNYTITLDSITDLCCFDTSGRLTPVGKERFWKELMAKLQEAKIADSLIEGITTSKVQSNERKQSYP